MDEQNELKEPDYSLLRKIGLGKTAVICYQDLWQNGMTNMADFARRCQVPRASAYKTLNLLEQLGFIEIIRVEGYVNYVSAYPLDVAIEHYFRYQLEQIRDLLSVAAFQALQPIKLPLRGLGQRQVIIC